jgi:putative transposase
MSEVHDLPGTTFSSVKEKEEYDSEKHAAMTISEFEEWLLTLICKIYHQRLHKGILMAPIKKWELGIFGNKNIPGSGLPQRPTDRLSVLLDFLPSYHRTIQRSGVSVDGLTYYSEDLRPWINAIDPENKKEKRKFIFRRDPRDLSILWFFDPELKQYFKVPYADQSLPSTSIWEFKRAREELRRQGVQSINQHQIFQAIAELRTKVEDSEKKTKKARRQSQRRRIHEKKTSPAVPLLEENPEPSNENSYGSGLSDVPVGDFGDIA